MKRLFDIVGATVGLVLLTPLGLLIALAIKLSDGGPIFYRQTRIGQFGKPFRIWKFRSMVLEADKLGLPLTPEADGRITWIGRFPAPAKLDELPQLWNVLVGEMSFVGPRPEVPRYVEQYRPEQRDILRYKPGITDVASMLFRNEQALLQGCTNVEDFYLRYCLPKKIELNREYARRASLAQDLWIILQTLCPYWLGVLAAYTGALVFSPRGGLCLAVRLSRAGSGGTRVPEFCSVGRVSPIDPARLARPTARSYQLRWPFRASSNGAGPDARPGPASWAALALRRPPRPAPEHLAAGFHPFLRRARRPAPGRAAAPRAFF